MKVAVISDTHDSIFSTREVLADIAAKGIDTIIHCGDLHSTYIIEEFKDFCLHHARGNNDFDFSIPIAIKEECKPGSSSDDWFKGVFDGKLVAAVHEEHSRRFSELLDSGLFDYIFVGHTHRKSDRTVGKTRIINPGAIGGAHRGPRGYIIIDFATGEIEDIFIE